MLTNYCCYISFSTSLKTETVKNVIWQAESYQLIYDGFQNKLHLTICTQQKSTSLWISSCVHFFFCKCSISYCILRVLVWQRYIFSVMAFKMQYGWITKNYFLTGQISDGLQRIKISNYLLSCPNRQGFLNTVFSSNLYCWSGAKYGNHFSWICKLK